MSTSSTALHPRAEAYQILVAELRGHMYDRTISMLALVNENTLHRLDQGKHTPSLSTITKLSRLKRFLDLASPKGIPWLEEVMVYAPEEVIFGYEMLKDGLEEEAAELYLARTDPEKRKSAQDALVTAWEAKRRK